MSVILFTGTLSTPSFTSQSNEIIDDSIEEFTFGFVQLSSAAHITETYATVTTADVTSQVTGDMYIFDITTAANIPETPDAYINSVTSFGYAWLDSNSFPANAVIATIHPQLSDVNPNPSEWHSETIVIDSAGCITDTNNAPSFIQTQGNVMQVHLGGFAATVDPSNLQSTSSYELVMDTVTCPSPLTGLKMVK